MFKNRIFKIIIIILVVISFIAFLAQQFGFFISDNILLKVLFIISAIIAPSVAYDYLKEMKSKVVVKEDNYLYEDADISDLLHELEELQLNESKSFLEKVKSTQIKYINDLKCYFYRDPNNKEISETYNIVEKIIEITPRVLIIGDSGSGKTTLIHQFISVISEDNNNQKIPLFISLSKYKGEANLLKWIADTIEEKFSIDNKIIETFIRKRKIIFCLDGLDEVSDLYKIELVNKLRGFAKTFPVFLTCRILEFKSLPVNFKKEFSFCELIPLEKKQIVDSLGTKYQNAVTQKLSAFDFVKTPLILNVIATVSDEFNPREKELISQQNNSSKVIQMIWEKYDFVMFDKKLRNNSDDTKYNLSKEKQSKLRFWFVWLAKHIDKNSSEFFIEQIQPNWLDKNEQKFYYLISRIFLGILISVGVGFFLSSPYDLIHIGILLGAVMGIISYLKQNYVAKKITSESKANQIYHLFAKNRFIDNIIHFSIIFLILSFITVLYMGFTVPRKPSDMILNGYFARTEAYVGIFISLFFATIFGFRNQWQTSDYDIRPVEQIIPDWKQFLTFGAIGGISVSVLLFICGYLIEQFFSESTFGVWLTDEEVSVFGLNGPILGLIFGFIFGFPLFSIIGWLNYNQLSIEKEEKRHKKYFSNYGIKKSLINALYTGLIVWIILGGLYGFYIWIETNSLKGLFKGIREGFGASLIAALWFGGSEFIQHWCIRLSLYVYGYSPFFWTKYIKYGKSLTFLRQMGANYSFYHRTLKDYFKQKSTNETNLKRINNKITGRIFFVIVIIGILYSFFSGIKNRYYNSIFWKDSNDQFNYIIKDTSNIARIDHNTFEIKKSGKLNIKTKGKYKIGTFTGYVHSNGTEVGFLGMPIGDKYDSIPNLPHASLLYKLKSNDIWETCIKTDSTFKFIPKKYGYINISSKDTIEFLINDKEWQNNTGTIEIELDISDTCNLE